jgi:hypothetical protein
MTDHSPDAGHGSGKGSAPHWIFLPVLDDVSYSFLLCKVQEDTKDEAQRAVNTTTHHSYIESKLKDKTHFAIPSSFLMRSEEGIK